MKLVRAFLGLVLFLSLSIGHAAAVIAVEAVGDTGVPGGFATVKLKASAPGFVLPADVFGMSFDVHFDSATLTFSEMLIGQQLPEWDGIAFPNGSDDLLLALIPSPGAPTTLNEDVLFGLVFQLNGPTPTFPSEVSFACHFYDAAGAEIAGGCLDAATDPTPVSAFISVNAVPAPPTLFLFALALLSLSVVAMRKPRRSR